MKIVAMIPVRAGSKSIPKKNCKPLAGKPLVLWVATAALHASSVDEVYVATDSDDVRDVVNASGLGIQLIDRDPSTCTDSASTESAMIDFMSRVEFDVLVLLQATSPLTTADDIDRAVARLAEPGVDSVHSCVEWKRFFWSNDAIARPINYDPASRPLRQNFEGWQMENGAIYVTPRETLEKHQCRIGQSPATITMPPYTAIEIDEPSDWEILESLVQRYNLG